MGIIEKVAITGFSQGRTVLFFLDLYDNGSYDVKKNLSLGPADSMSIHSMLGFNHFVFLADSLNNKIYKYDYDHDAMDETNVGRDPRHMCIDNDNMFVTNFESDNVSVIELNSFALTGSIPADIKPHDVKFVSDNLLYTSCYEENIIIENNLLDGSKKYFSTDGKPMHLFANKEEIIVMTYFVNGTISSKVNFIDIKTGEVKSIIKIHGLSSDIDYDDDNKLLYLINIEDKCLYIIDTGKRITSKKIFLGGYPESLCIGNENIYVTNSKKDQITVIEKATLNITNIIMLDFTPDLIKILS